MFKSKKQTEDDIKVEFYHNNIELFFPASAFDGYAIVDERKENLANICLVLNVSKQDLEKVNFEDKYEFVDSLVELKYITRDLQQEYDLVDMVTEINEVAKTLGYNIDLSIDDILRKDNEKKKEARELFPYLTNHDLNICAEIIETQNYELFQVFLDVGGFTMSILPKEKTTELKKYTQ